MTKLTSKQKKAWVDALRSGKYEQGKEILKRDGKYCCLGVLCDILCYDSSSRHTIRDQWGESAYIGCVTQSLLAGMNDDGKTFEEIADYIELKPLDELAED